MHINIAYLKFSSLYDYKAIATYDKLKSPLIGVLYLYTSTFGFKIILWYKESCRDCIRNDFFFFLSFGLIWYSLGVEKLVVMILEWKGKEKYDTVWLGA